MSSLRTLRSLQCLNIWSFNSNFDNFFNYQNYKMYCQALLNLSKLILIVFNKHSVLNTSSHSSNSFSRKIVGENVVGVEGRISKFWYLTRHKKCIFCMILLLSSWNWKKWTVHFENRQNSTFCHIAYVKWYKLKFAMFFKMSN